MIDRDQDRYFRYASLQSEMGQQLTGKFNIDQADTDSVILIENYEVYVRSTAALRTARRLKGPVKLLYGFIIIPPFLRNMMYDWIARNRYRWFGKREECRVPTPDLQSLFLE